MNSYPGQPLDPDACCALIDAITDTLKGTLTAPGPPGPRLYFLTGRRKTEFHHTPLAPGAWEGKAPQQVISGLLPSFRSLSGAFSGLLSGFGSFAGAGYQADVELRLGGAGAPVPCRYLTAVPVDGPVVEAVTQLSPPPGGRQVHVFVRRPGRASPVPCAAGIHAALAELVEVVQAGSGRGTGIDRIM